MQRTVIVFRVLLSLFGLALIVLGGLFWSGRALTLVPQHMLLGALFAICLWLLVGLGLYARAGAGFALTVLIWSLIVLALGVGQVRLLPGPRHWLIETLHLLVGLIAIGLGHTLARRIVRARRAAVSGALR